MWALLVVHSAALVKCALFPGRQKGLREDLFVGSTNNCREDGAG